MNFLQVIFFPFPTIEKQTKQSRKRSGLAYQGKVLRRFDSCHLCADLYVFASASFSPINVRVIIFVFVMAWKTFKISFRSLAQDKEKKAWESDRKKGESLFFLPSPLHHVCSSSRKVQSVRNLGRVVKMCVRSRLHSSWATIWPLQPFQSLWSTLKGFHRGSCACVNTTAVGDFCISERGRVTERNGIYHHLTTLLSLSLSLSFSLSHKHSHVCLGDGLLLLTPDSCPSKWWGLQGRHIRWRGAPALPRPSLAGSAELERSHIVPDVEGMGQRVVVATEEDRKDNRGRGRDAQSHFIILV